MKKRSQRFESGSQYDKIKRGGSGPDGLVTEAGVQRVAMVLDGSLKESPMRRLICQVAKESEDFAILELKNSRA